VSSTAKTILIVGGVGIGVFLVARALTPSTSLPKSSAASSVPNVLGGLGSAFGSAFATALGTAGAKNQPTTSQPTVPGTDSAAVYTPGESFGDYTTGLFGPGINPDGTGSDA